MNECHRRWEEEEAEGDGWEKYHKIWSVVVTSILQLGQSSPTYTRDSVTSGTSKARTSNAQRRPTIRNSAMQVCFCFLAMAFFFFFFFCFLVVVASLKFSQLLDPRSCRKRHGSLITEGREVLAVWSARGSSMSRCLLLLPFHCIHSCWGRQWPKCCRTECRIVVISWLWSSERCCSCCIIIRRLGTPLLLLLASLFCCIWLMGSIIPDNW